MEKINEFLLLEPNFCTLFKKSSTQMHIAKHTYTIDLTSISPVYSEDSSVQQRKAVLLRPGGCCH